MLRLNSHFQKLEKTSQARHSGTTVLLVSGVRVFHEDYAITQISPSRREKVSGKRTLRFWWENFNRPVDACSLSNGVIQIIQSIVPYIWSVYIRIIHLFHSTLLFLPCNSNKRIAIILTLKFFTCATGSVIGSFETPWHQKGPRFADCSFWWWKLVL